jgi:hypothetical protein
MLYRIYDDRVGETTRFTYRPDHEWYWFPQQKPSVHTAFPDLGADRPYHQPDDNSRP